MGYDPEGADQHGGACVGGCRWVGPTDLAALCRGFMGVPASIVDFDGAGAGAVVDWLEQHFRERGEAAVRARGAAVPAGHPPCPCPS